MRATHTAAYASSLMWLVNEVREVLSMMVQMVCLAFPTKWVLVMLALYGFVKSAMWKIRMRLMVVCRGAGIAQRLPSGAIGVSYIAQDGKMYSIVMPQGPPIVSGAILHAETVPSNSAGAPVDVTEAIMAAYGPNSDFHMNSVTPRQLGFGTIRVLYDVNGDGSLNDSWLVVRPTLPIPSRCAGDE